MSDPKKPAAATPNAKPKPQSPAKAHRLGKPSNPFLEKNPPPKRRS